MVEQRRPSRAESDPEHRRILRVHVCVTCYPWGAEWRRTTPQRSRRRPNCIGSPHSTVEHRRPDSVITPHRVGLPNCCQTICSSAKIARASPLRAANNVGPFVQNANSIGHDGAAAMQYKASSVHFRSTMVVFPLPFRSIIDFEYTDIIVGKSY